MTMGTPDPRVFPPPKVGAAEPGKPAKDLRNAWYCPVDGTRLSYGVYCKTCKRETSFAYRPPPDDELERAMQEWSLLPPPSYPHFIQD